MGDAGGPPMRTMRDILGGSRAALQSAGETQNAIDPYQYSLAGLTPQYAGDDNTAQISDLTAKTSAAQDALTQFLTTKGSQKDVKAALAKAGIDPKQLKGPGGLKGKLVRYLQAQRGQIDTAAAGGRRITGFTEDPTQATARGKERALYGQEQSLLEKSLSQTPEDILAADPALKRQLEEEQAKLQQSQVQQFGTLAGAQGGTIGAVQNAAMAQRRAEAISQARRENIGLYAGLTTQQGQLNLQQNAGRMGLAAAPGAARQQLAQGGEQLGGSFGQLAALQIGKKQAQNQMQFQANAFNQTQPGVGESILKGIGSLLQPMKSSG